MVVISTNLKQVSNLFTWESKSVSFFYFGRNLVKLIYYREKLTTTLVHYFFVKVIFKIAMYPIES